MEHVSGLTRLHHLNLWKTEVTDAWMAHLKGLSQLQTLDLTKTKITDAGLAYVKRLTNLLWITLSDTQVTDAGLVQLKGLTQLQRLDLRNTKVTDAGAGGLQKALPNCKILHGVIPTPSATDTILQSGKIQAGEIPQGEGIITLNDGKEGVLISNGKTQDIQKSR